MSSLKLLTNLWKLKILGTLKSIKVLTNAGASKWKDVLGSAALTNGWRKMGERLIFSIVLLSKEIL